jgi:hypothetical protein
MRARLRTTLVGFALLALAAAAHGEGLRIHPVAADPQVFDPARGERVTVRFGLSAPAEAALLVYDARDFLVRRVVTKGSVPAGEHALVWDGRDDAGRRLPPEAYHYTVEARAAGETVVYDLTDPTGTDAVIARDVAWDPAARVVRYLLPERSRVNVRIGIQNGGPLLRTLVNWLPREAGIQEEPWDARDASGAIDLAAHPRLELVVHAVGLPANTLVIGPRMSERTPFVALERPERRAATPQPGRRARSFAAQPVEQLRDVAIALRLPEGLPRGADGVPIVRGPVAVEMDIPDRAERERMLAERIETAFYVDGLYQFENESGVLPTTWTWDPARTPPGEHYLTGNLIGIEGHFGTATLRVRIPNPE